MVGLLSTYTFKGLAVYFVCVILNTNLDYLIKLLLFALLYIALFFASSHIFDERLPLLLPLSIGVGTKVWYHIIWFTHLQHHAGALATQRAVRAAQREVRFVDGPALHIIIRHGVRRALAVRPFEDAPDPDQSISTLFGEGSSLILGPA